MAVLLLTMIAAGTAFGVLSFASHSMQLTRRALDYQSARMGAEAGLDYGLVALRDQICANPLTLSQSSMQALLDGVSAPPAYPGFQYETPGAATAFSLTADTGVLSGTIPEGVGAVGADGIYQYFTVVSGVYNATSQVGSVLKTRVLAASVPVNRFGVFYEEDLEIAPVSTLTIDGPVHANGDLFLSDRIRLTDRVTVEGRVLYGHKYRTDDEPNVEIADDVGTLQDLVQSGVALHHENPNWPAGSLTRWVGQVADRAHSVPRLAVPIHPASVPHAIIERPLPVTNINYRVETELEKFATKAALTIHVSAAGVFTATDYLAVDKTSEFSVAVLNSNGTHNGYALYEREHHNPGDEEYEMTSVGTYTLDAPLFDAREGVEMAVLDIYIDQLFMEFPELTDGTYSVAQGKGILYVTRDDPDGIGGRMPAVRIRNADDLPSYGLTIATDCPLYIEGNYNTQTGPEPSLLAGDSVTLLSRGWRDAYSWDPLASRAPTGTTVNATLLTGNTDTTGITDYNGGLQDVVRLLEDWNGAHTLTFNGAVGVLWNSRLADSPFVASGTYFTTPFRIWNYDTQYATAEPPGVPWVMSCEPLAWEQTTWADQGW